MTRRDLDELADLVAERLGGPPAGPAVMTANDAATFLGVNPKTVYEYADRGWIPHQRIGKRLLFSRQAILDWLACKSAP